MRKEKKTTPLTKRYYEEVLKGRSQKKWNSTGEKTVRAKITWLCRRCHRGKE